MALTMFCVAAAGKEANFHENNEGDKDRNDDRYYPYDDLAHSFLFSKETEVFAEHIINVLRENNR